MGKKELPVEEMVKDKKNGFTQTQLEIKYGVSMTTISKRIDEYYQNKGKERPKKKTKKERKKENQNHIKKYLLKRL